MNDAIRILVDADACPVKDEIYRVAKRMGLAVTLVSNSWMRVPLEPWIELVVVKAGFDEADDWIAERATDRVVVITADIPLAARCVKAGARVLGHKGDEFTDDNIGNALAMRDLLADLREAGESTRGPAPLQKRDRSNFLEGLDRVIVSMRRQSRGA